MPRLTIRAGFELGTGVEVNVYPPERAAADLRAALDGAGRGAVGSRTMPPLPRPFPRFIADSPQEGKPYGRWEERLAEELAKACEPHASEAGAPLDPRRVRWFPERTWGGRVYVPATGRRRARGRAG